MRADKTFPSSARPPRSSHSRGRLRANGSYRGRSLVRARNRDATSASPSREFNRCGRCTQPLQGWTGRFAAMYFMVYIVETIVNHTRLSGESLRMTIIRAKHLTTFSVAPDGSSVAIGVADEEGQSAALMLPAECLMALIMTLPDMMRRALRLQHGDPSLRLVYPVASWEVEY